MSGTGRAGGTGAQHARHAGRTRRRCTRAPQPTQAGRRLCAAAYCRRFFWLHQLTQGAQSRQKVPAGHSMISPLRQKEDMPLHW